MSTRSRIGLLYPDQTGKTIYVHWNGEPKIMEDLLNKYYKSYEKVHEMMELGNASVLKKYLNPKTKTHSFTTPEKDVSLFYIRDRNENADFNSAIYFENSASMLKDICNSKAEYAYIYNVSKDEWLTIHLLKKEN